jgi:hypothetical protein
VNGTLYPCSPHLHGCIGAEALNWLLLLSLLLPVPLNFEKFFIVGLVGSDAVLTFM